MTIGLGKRLDEGMEESFERLKRTKFSTAERDLCNIAVINHDTNPFYVDPIDYSTRVKREFHYIILMHGWTIKEFETKLDENMLW